jgi:hypothetical protein
MLQRVGLVLESVRIRHIASGWTCFTTAIDQYFIGLPGSIRIPRPHVNAVDIRYLSYSTFPSDRIPYSTFPSRRIPYMHYFTFCPSVVVIKVAALFGFFAHPSRRCTACRPRSSHLILLRLD